MFEALTILIILTGMLFIFLSYYVDEKKQNNSDKIIDEYEEYQSKITEINNKIFELNEFSEFVKNQIDEKHQELLFLYHLISEKHKDIESDSLEKGSLNSNMDSTIDGIQNTKDTEQHLTINKNLDSTNHNVLDEEMEKALATTYNKESIQSVDNNERDERNRKILELAGEGYKVNEIAKILEIGQGEVGLVINLFQ